MTDPTLERAREVLAPFLMRNGQYASVTKRGMEAAVARAIEEEAEERGSIARKEVLEGLVAAAHRRAELAEARVKEERKRADTNERRWKEAEQALRQALEERDHYLHERNEEADAAMRMLAKAEARLDAALALLREAQAEIEEWRDEWRASIIKGFISVTSRDRGEADRADELVRRLAAFLEEK